jgi:hypothetical protein
VLKRVILGLVFFVMPYGGAVTAHELLVQFDRLFLHLEKMPVHPFLTGKNFARIFFFKESAYEGLSDFTISRDVVRSLFSAEVSDRFVEDSVTEFIKLSDKAELFFGVEDVPYKILETIPQWFAVDLLSEYWSKGKPKDSFALRHERSLQRAQALTEKEKAEVALNDFFLRVRTKSWQLLLRDWELFT